MDVENQSGAAESKATISFPVGLALLVIVLLGITAFFFCCLYWDRLRSLLYGPNVGDSLQTIEEKPLPADHPMGKKIDEEARSVTVLMPGDDVPKFIAMACPCEPPIPERMIVVVHKSV